MSDEINTNQSPEQPVEQSSVTSTPNTNKIQEISEFYQEKKATTNEATAEPILERSPIDYYIGAFRKYADFSGRATRSEYWYFFLFYYLVYIGLTIVDGVIGSNNGLISTIYILGALVPSFALSARRLHDIGKNGWFQLIGFLFLFIIIGVLYVIGVLVQGIFRDVDGVIIQLIGLGALLIPTIGLIWLFTLYATDSTPGANKYGPNPKGIES